MIKDILKWFLAVVGSVVFFCAFVGIVILIPDDVFLVGVVVICVLVLLFFMVTGFKEWLDDNL